MVFSYSSSPDFTTSAVLGNGEIVNALIPSTCFHRQNCQLAFFSLILHSFVVRNYYI